MNPERYIGCCGAYCKPCPPYVEGSCKGCKLGYDTGERDISKARCRIKLCCFKDSGFETCAECPEVEACDIAGDFHARRGRKYGKYRQALEFIRKNGYARFIKAAAGWTNACGGLE